jgi:hypothetical protein
VAKRQKVLTSFALFAFFVSPFYLPFDFSPVFPNPAYSDLVVAP